VKGTLRGFLDIALTVEGGHPLAVYECPVDVGPNGPWVAFPGKAQIERDGTIRRNLGTGKVEYARVLKWLNGGDPDKFSAAVVKLLLARHLAALDGEKKPS
jgi:hypothetical protein